MQDVKLFAFKLAEKTEQNDTTWQVRDDVSLAGCTDPSGEGNYRFPHAWGGTDNGVWC